MKIFFFLVIVFLSATTRAEVQQPRISNVEKKFRTYIYKPNQIYRFIGHYNFQSFLEFEDGEEVGTISMGDTTSWQVQSLGNRIFFKPVLDNANTNMTVITNKRIYNFELEARDSKGNFKDSDLIYSVKFIYPDKDDKTILRLNVKKSELPDLTDLSKYNFNYSFTGEATIAPKKVFDNGEFTYFEFANKNAKVPAIFAVDAEGYETLVNFRTVDNFIIIEMVTGQYTLRHGGDIVCVYNKAISSRK